MGMDLTKEFVNSCRKVGVLRDFLCQAIDQVDEKDKEIAKLKEQYKDMDVTHTVHIAKMNGYIHHLEEERRWRKCCEGLPSKGQRVLFLAKYKTDKVREWIGDFRHIDGMEIGFAVFYASTPGWGCEFLIDEVIGWMPLPSAPKED